jgi:2-dehydro-3-deoxygalactonokinase
MLWRGTMGAILNSEIDWVAVDWGTSNLRAWGIDGSGSVAFAASSPEGMGKISREDYPRVLQALLAEHVASEGRPLDVLVCGMAGARQGWREAPYLDAPADLASLSFGAVEPQMEGGRLRPCILPGVCQKQHGAEDVMRGEETQLLGLSALLHGFSGLVVMPGTHSKWATLEGRRLTRFSSAMTGEIFDVLKTHSVLRHSLGGDTDGPERADGWSAGLDTGLSAPQRLTAMLFKVRASSLLSGRSPSWCAGYLSGLLIGAEIGGQRDWLGTAEIPLVGGTALCQLYAEAFAAAGARTRIIDATDATLAGLKAARQG